MMSTHRFKITKDSVLGNALTANVDLDAAALIVGIPESFLMLVEHDALDQVCSYCFAEATPEKTLKSCGACKVVRYCSPSCQNADWKSLHVKECKILRELPDIPPTPVRAVIQLLLRHSHTQVLDSDRQWAGLESHIHEFKQGGRYDDLVLQAKAAVEFSKSPPYSMELAIQLLCRMATNAFRITSSSDESPIGLCFEPVIALANHSCNPNAIVLFDGRGVSLRTLNPIKQGEQIFISYIDPTEPREIRRAELQQRYFFLCNCQKCVDDDTPYHTYLRTASESSSHKVDYLCGRRSEEVNGDIAHVGRKNLTTCESRNLGTSHKTSSIVAGGVCSYMLEHLGDQFEEEHENLPTIAQNCVDRITPEIRTNLERNTTTFTSLSKQFGSLPSTTRLSALQQEQALLTPLIHSRLYALEPCLKFIYGLYAHHLINRSWLPTLNLLLFLTIRVEPLAYPQPHHPHRLLNLYQSFKLLKFLATEPMSRRSSMTSILPLKLSDELVALEASLDYISAAQAVLIVTQEQVCRCHGATSRLAKEIEEQIKDIEEVQALRGSSAGIELRSWMLHGDQAQAGSEMAERLFGQLRKLADFAAEIIRSPFCL